MLSLYRGITGAAAPLLRFYLARRMAHGKEDSERLAERLGVASQARPAGPLVWIHAASVGESISVLALIERLATDYPGLSILITTGTVSSARLLAERLPDSVIHQFAPVDRVAWVRRFLDHWRPDLALWIESEFWPNLLSEVGARGIPSALVNARMSPRSFAGWRRAPRAIRQLLSVFTLILAQSEADADKFRRLGAKRATNRGNLKFAASPLPAAPAALRDMTERLGSRPRWLAASTHAGEEKIIAAAHRRLKNDWPDLLTIIVPRHPARGPSIAEALRREGLAVGLRSACELPSEAIEAYIADTMGELGLFFRLAGIAFVGGSLIPHGGQNVLEAAKLGCAVIHGPHMTNFDDIVAEMRDAGAAVEAADAIAIGEAVAALLGDEMLRVHRAAAGKIVATAKEGILDAIMSELAPCLDGIGDSETVSAHHACS